MMLLAAIALNAVGCNRTNSKPSTEKPAVSAADSDSVKNNEVDLSLIDASDSEIVQAALAYARDRNMIAADDVEILFNQLITKSELADVRLGVGEFAGQTPPLQLIVFKGRFDFSNLPHSTQRAPGPFPYMAYVMDLNAGLPTTTIGSYDGAEFKQVLNDSSLSTQN